MPRTKLDKYSKPRLDPVKGLILSASRDQKKTNDDLAVMAKVSRTTFQAMLNKHSDTWPLRRTLDLCNGLYISIDDLRSAIRY